MERGQFAALWGSADNVASAVTLSASELALFVEGCTVVGNQVLTPKPCLFKM
ncbi:MAG: hypothetical protein KBG15_15660 [Kofleriaceae bacterium]|nr:hypothetical protein [Kofleriaceae bacterium]